MSGREILDLASIVQGKLEELQSGIVDHIDLGDWLEENGHTVVNALRCVGFLHVKASSDER